MIVYKQYFARFVHTLAAQKLSRKEHNHHITICSIMHATFPVAERKPEKFQAYTLFEPMTSAIPVPHSNQLS